MAERSAQGQTLGRRVANAVGDHRTNDLIFGHLGRLSYVPANDDEGGVGDLRCNRITNQSRLLSSVSGLPLMIPSPVLSRGVPISDVVSSHDGRVARRQA